MAHTVIVNPSVNVKLVYSALHNYNDLIKEGIATEGDIIIEASTGGHGVMHINDTDFYFAGVGHYDYQNLDANGNPTVSWEHDDTYLKVGLLNNGDLKITGTYYATGAELSNLFVDTVYYKDTKNLKNAQIFTIKSPTSKKSYYTVVFGSSANDVVLDVDDIIINGKMFTDNYIDKKTIAENYVSKDQLGDTVDEVKDMSTYIHTEVSALQQDINNVVYDISTDLSSVYKTIYDESTYLYPEDLTKNKENTDRDDIHSLKEAIDILLENLYYTSPSAVKATASISPTTFINGEDTSVIIDYNVTNYLDSNITVTLGGVTYHTFQNEIVKNAYNQTLSYTINITTDYKDSHNVSPAAFTKTLTCSMKTEDYIFSDSNIYTSASDIDIDTYNKKLSDDIEASSLLLNRTSDTTTSKVFTGTLATSGYLYLALYNVTDGGSFSIKKQTTSGSTIVSSTITNIGDINLTKYQHSVTYGIYKSNEIFEAGTYNITVTYSSGGSGTTEDLVWEEV